MAYILEYAENNIEEIAARLNRGEVGIFPCDTIYGICAKVSKESADRIYEIKERPLSKSFIELMLKDDIVEAGLKVGSDLLDLWPAPFTAIVENREGSTTALRVPSDTFLQKILSKTGPIYSTSVNVSGQASLLRFDDIFPVFGDKVDFIVNHPNLVPGQSSTLINAVKKPYQIIRQGAYKFD